MAAKTKQGGIMRKISVVVVIFIGLMLLPILPANATFIDLNDFFADPTVTVESTGFSALIEEDAGLEPEFPVILSNDPYLGDPEVIFPGLLSFEYDFMEGFENNDEFRSHIGHQLRWNGVIDDI